MTDTVVIPANADVAYHVKGKVFAVLAATGDFQVELDHGGYEDAYPGYKQGPGDKFKRLRFRDTSGAANTVKFYAGDADVSPNLPTNTTGTAVNVSFGRGDASQTPFAKTSSTPGTPVALKATSTKFRKAVIKAQKSLARAENTGNVYLGPTNGALVYTLAPGDDFVIEAPQDQDYDFADWFLDVVNGGDGVTVTYS